MRTLKLILFAAAVWAGGVASVWGAGTVRTVDGKVYDGELRFDQNKLLVSPKKGTPLKIDLSDLLQVSFKPTEAPRPQPPAPGVGQVPANWKPMDIGGTGTPGDVRVYNGTYAAKGAGAGVGGKADSFYFISQELHGDVALTARVLDMQRGDGHAKAGLMIRSALDPAAKHVFLFVTPREGPSILWRQDTAGDTAHSTPARGETAPIWLRLVRRQSVITAFKSADGANWTQVEQREIPLEPKSFLGLAVCSHDRAGTLAATFDNVKIEWGAPRDDEANRRNAGNAQPLSRGIVFRRGTVLANVQLISATEKSIQLQGPDGKPLTFPTEQVARLILAPLSPQILAKIPERGSGVLLARGDFMEGELQGFSNGRVKLSSVLFGLSNFAAGSEAAVLVLNDPQPSRSTWIVRANDGSIYCASNLKIERDQLLIDDDSAGAVKVPVWNLLEIKAGEARFDPLIELKPAKIEPGTLDPAKAFVAGSASALQLSLDGLPTGSAVAMRAGTSVTYDLGGKYKIFLARAGVPWGTLPTTPVRYALLVDGVEAYRSPPLTGLEDPAVVSVNLAGAKSITLRVDPSPAGLSGTMLWSEPALMK